MDHGFYNPELIEAIQESRMREAERRRAISAAQLRTPLTEWEAMRMAVGPGIQFAGVTERVLDTVTHRVRHRPAA